MRQRAHRPREAIRPFELSPPRFVALFIQFSLELLRFPVLVVVVGDPVLVGERVHLLQVGYLRPVQVPAGARCFPAASGLLQLQLVDIAEVGASAVAVDDA